MEWGLGVHMCMWVGEEVFSILALREEYPNVALCGMDLRFTTFLQFLSCE